MVRIRLDVSQPLIFGYSTPNNEYGVNWIEFNFQELPRLFCYFCQRLGHLGENCIDLFMLNNPIIHAPLAIIPPPLPEQNSPDFHVDLAEFINNNEENFEDDWNFEFVHSPSSSFQDHSTFSFTGSDQLRILYIPSDVEMVSSDSDRIFYEENEVPSLINELPSNLEESAFNSLKFASLSANYIVSDIEADQVLSSLRPTPLSSPSYSHQSQAAKRLNPDQLHHLLKEEAGSSSTSIYNHVSQEEVAAWSQLYSSPKRPRTDSYEVGEDFSSPFTVSEPIRSSASCFISDAAPESDPIPLVAISKDSLVSNLPQVEPLQLSAPHIEDHEIQG